MLKKGKKGKYNNQMIINFVDIRLTVNAPYLWANINEAKTLV